MHAAGSAPISFGKYLLDAELARGGMSRVWQARLRGPGGFEKQLVVKQILPQLAQDPSFVELLVQEANTLVRMSHPNIVPVYELGIVDGVYFLAMERVRGATVAELLRSGPLPPALVAELGVQVAEALRYAHERFELVHRDVTPRNVMVDADGHVRLLDFGIAAPSARTGKGELFGSPGYMSPEQAARKALTPASDLYGLGAVLFEALTGRRAVVAGVANRASDTANGPDTELATLIDELLATDPLARGSAARTVSRLRAWLTQKQPEGAREQLGKRVDELRVQTEASAQPGATRARPDGVAAEHEGAVQDGEGSGGSGAHGVTRSIATSVTLTEMLAPGTTEALPRPGTADRQLTRARGIALGVGFAGAAIVAAFLAFTPATQDVPVEQPEANDSRAPKPPIATPAAAEARPTGATVAGATAIVAPNPSPGTAGAGGAFATALAAASATLTIHATPWAEARLDGKALGATPQRAVRVRPGAHVLGLDCPPLGRKARVPLHLRAGTHAQVVVDMQTDPPTVSVR